MKVWLPLLLIAVFIGCVVSCRKGDNSPIPYIELIALSPDTVKGGSLTDTVDITFNFSDGDGDLGNDVGVYDFFLRDSRDSAIDILRFPFPDIPEEARDPIDGIRGTGAIRLPGHFIQLRQDTLHTFHGDTLTYEMWITDRASNMSNIVKTPPIYIRPK